MFQVETDIAPSNPIDTNQMNSSAFPFFLLAISVAARNTIAAPTPEPKTSQITLEVSDSDGQRVPGVAVALRRLAGDPTEFVAEGETDVHGEVVQVLPVPVGVPIGLYAEVRKVGYYPQTVQVVAVPGARLTREITLAKQLTTTLRFFETDGSVAAYRRITTGNWYVVAADGKGEYRFSHPPLDRPMYINFRGEVFWLEKEEAGGVKEIRPVGLRYLPPPGGSPTADLGERNTPARVPIGRVRGRLVGDDGQPARGWFVAQRVIRSGGWGSFCCSDPSLELYSFNYRELDEVAADGAFELFPAHEELIAISPEGLPFRYPLNPVAWRDGDFVKETEITVPQLKSRKWKLRFGSEDGAAAADVEVLPSKIGSSYDIWDLFPGLTEWTDLRYYAGSEPPPPLEARLKHLATSDADGEINLSIHPWRKIQEYRWRLADGKPDEWGSFSIGTKESASGVIVLEKQAIAERKPETYRKLICSSFSDSYGNKVDPEQIRWNTYLEDIVQMSGKGGFVGDEKSGFAMFVSGVKDRVEFSCKNSRGGAETFNVRFGEQGALPTGVEVKFQTAGNAPPSLWGKVIGSDGKPAKGVGLTLTWRRLADSRAKYPQVHVKSDRAGKFMFAKAPPECGFYVYAIHDRYSYSLDGLVDIPTITPTNREIEIRVKPVGAVRVKLVGAKVLPRHLLLRAEDEKQLGRKYFMLYPTREEPSVFFSPYVAPGNHPIAASSSDDGLEWLREEPISVQAGKETNLEIRPPKRMSDPAPDEALVPVSVTVMRDGKPVTGAIVKTHESSVPRQPHSDGDGHVTSYIGDTTDMSGRAQFLAKPGGKFFCTAVDHELRIAWETVEITGQDIDLKLELRPIQEITTENGVEADGLERTLGILGLRGHTKETDKDSILLRELEARRRR